MNRLGQADSDEPRRLPNGAPRTLEPARVSTRLSSGPPGSGPPGSVECRQANDPAVQARTRRLKLCSSQPARQPAAAGSGGGAGAELHACFLRKKQARARRAARRNSQRAFPVRASAHADACARKTAKGGWRRGVSASKEVRQRGVSTSADS